MKKITILALHLGYGGIEKCISSLANALCDNYEVEIIAVYKLYNEPPFKLDDSIKVNYLIDDNLAIKVESYKINLFNFHFIKLFKELFNDYLKKGKFVQLVYDTFNSGKIVKLKKQLMIKAIKECNSDIIISTRDIHNLWLGKYGKKGTIKIGWEHNHHNNDETYINKIVESVSNLDYFVLVSKELEQFYRQKLKDKKCQTIYIPNTLDYYPKNVSQLEDKNIVSVGRLSKEKGYLDLIDVFKLVNEVYPDWKLNIIGDGVEKTKIEEKVKKYNLENNIILHGFRDKEYINKILKKSSIYVMCSHTESFGIVLLEAFSFGIPCVAFDSAQGATEIISNNWDGYLIKDRDKEKMAKKICELIKNENRRIIMGANGIKKADNYNIDKIKEEWIKIIEKSS